MKDKKERITEDGGGARARGNEASRKEEREAGIRQGDKEKQKTERDRSKRGDRDTTTRSMNSRALLF